MDILSFITDFQSFAVVPSAVTDIAGHIHIGEKMHLDPEHPGSLTGLTAPPLDIEGKTPPPYILWLWPPAGRKTDRGSG